MVYSNRPLTEIAYDCGFTDSSYFIKVFRHYKHMSPTSVHAWRQGTKLSSPITKRKRQALPAQAGRRLSFLFRAVRTAVLSAREPNGQRKNIKNGGASLPGTRRRSLPCRTVRDALPELRRKFFSDILEIDNRLILGGSILELLNNLLRVAGDDQLLVGADDPDRNRGIRGEILPSLPAVISSLSTPSILTPIYLR